MIFFIPTTVGIDRDLATIAKCPSGPPKTLTRPETLVLESVNKSAGLKSSEIRI